MIRALERELRQTMVSKVYNAIMDGFDVRLFKTDTIAYQQWWIDGEWHLKELTKEDMYQ